MSDFKLQYNKVLDGFLRAVDAYAELSLKVRDGEISAAEAIQKYDEFLAPIAMILMMLDRIRGEESLLRRAGTGGVPNDASIEDQVEAFKRQLDNI